MDPATLKIVLQLAQVLGKSRAARAVVAGVLALIVGTGAATAYGPWMLGTHMTASLYARQQLALNGNCGQPTEVAAQASGTASAEKGEASVWRALRSAGFDDVHAAGVMGNMKAESGFDPQIVQGGGHATRPGDAGSRGYGLVQWTPGRKLSDYIGSATPTVANQVETLKAQLEGRGPHPERAAGDAFWATSDVAAAARVFHLRYERSASTDSSQRVRNALSIHQRLHGISVDAPSAAAAPAGQPAPQASSTTKSAIRALAKTQGAPITPHLDPQGEPAFDIMSTGSKNAAIAEALRTDHIRYGLRYVISQMRIASAKSDWQWRAYSPITNQGDFRHVNHVHASYVDGSSDAPGTAPGAVEAATGCDPGSMPAAKIITWNSFHGRKYPDERHGNDRRVVDGMLALAMVGNVIGGQELSDGDRKAAVNKALDRVGWAFVATHTSHPIYFDRKVWALEQDDTTEVYERGDSIEGNDQGDRYVVTAVLRSRATGQLLTVINMHQLPHIQKHGVLDKKQPKRVRMAVAAWRVMAAAVAKHKPTSAVVVVGDMNYDGDPRGIYRAAGLTMASKVFGTQDTLRKREIDQVLFTAGRPVAQQILGRYGSDHAARMVTFTASMGGGQTSPAAAAVSPVGFNFPGQRTVDQAIAYMSDGHRVDVGTCLHEVGAAYGHQGTTRVNGHYYATGQWDAMPARYKHTDGSTPPRGALVFWDTRNVAGHIAISAGDGKVWTTDPDGHPGTIALVDIAMPDRWGPAARLVPALLHRQDQGGQAVRRTLTRPAPGER